MMRKKFKLLKRVLSLTLVLILCVENFAAIVSDNDGSAFITKAEFDSLKNNFQSQIDQYNTSIDQKIDGAIAAYLAGIRVSKTTEERFPVGAGEKAVLCWSDKITNMAFGKATLDFNFQITDFFNGPDRAANNESAGSITMTRTGNSNYELFNCNASGNKFKYYTKNANIELTGAWNFIQRADYSGTTDSSNYKLRWHGGAFGITTLNRASATAGSSNYYDDRFNKFGFATIYGTQLNYGNAWNGGVGASERIYSSTTSVNINVDDSNKVLWIMDNATANSRNWVWDPEVNKDRIVASARGLYSTTNQQYDTPNAAGITTSGRIFFRLKYYTTTDWSTYQKNLSIPTNVWTTTGRYERAGTTVTAGKWFEFHLAPGTNPDTVGATGEFQNSTNLVNSNVPSSVLSDYSSYGWTGTVTQGLPIGIFKNQGSIEFDVNTSETGQTQYFAIQSSPFNPRNKALENITTVDGLSDLTIDGVAKTNFSNAISAGNHKIKFNYDFATPTALFYKLGWASSATDANKARRLIMTLPDKYKLTVEQ